MFGMVLHKLSLGSANSLEFINGDMCELHSTPLLQADSTAHHGLASCGIQLKSATDRTQIGLKLINREIRFWKFRQHSEFFVSSLVARHR